MKSMILFEKLNTGSFENPKALTIKLVSSGKKALFEVQSNKLPPNISLFNLIADPK